MKPGCGLAAGDLAAGFGDRASCKISCLEVSVASRAGTPKADLMYGSVEVYPDDAASLLFSPSTSYRRLSCLEISHCIRSANYEGSNDSPDTGQPFQMRRFDFEQHHLSDISLLETDQDCCSIRAIIARAEAHQTTPCLSPRGEGEGDK